MRGAWLAVGLLLQTACLPSRYPAIDSEGRASLDAILSDAVEAGAAAGVVAIVTGADSVLYRGAFGSVDAAHEEPMRDDAVFRIFSMTKPITTVALMMLVEQRLVDLDAPASDYLPELAGREVLVSVDPTDSSVVTRPASRPPTVRDLLRHTSGIGYTFSNQELLAWTRISDAPALSQPLLHDPGVHWTYGANTYFVGRIVEEVSGESLGTFFRSRIFLPLGMHDTSFELPDAKMARLVSLHRRRGNRLEGEARPSRYEPIVRGDGGLLSTADDYARFIRMILGHGEANGVRLLSSSSVAEMTRDQLVELGIKVSEQPGAIPETSSAFPLGAGLDGFGLGFQIDAPDNPSPRAGGSLSWAGLWNTHFWIDPTNGVGVVFLTQVLPFADKGVMDLLMAFEAELYNHLP